jgi:hypothetical protein
VKKFVGLHLKYKRENMPKVLSTGKTIFYPLSVFPSPCHGVSSVGKICGRL